MHMIASMVKQVEFSGVSRENLNKKQFYGHYLLNMITYNRIWFFLNHKSRQRDHGLIKKVISGLLLNLANGVPLSDIDELGTNMIDIKSDVAAQLKESELSIPLQLPGLKHAVLIGDECQLSSLVKSKNV